MAGIKALIGLAAAGCIGLTFLVLGCALNPFQAYWPLFVLIFYFLAPLPLLIAGKYQDDMTTSSASLEFAYFATTGIVVSAFGLPIVLACAGAIQPWALACILPGNVICLLTVFAYFYMHRADDDYTAGLF